MKFRLGSKSRYRRGRPAAAPSVGRVEGLESRVLLAASLVKDINIDREGSGARPGVNVGGTLYFSAWERDHGGELWKSDGTQAGTALVADLFPGPGGSDPASLMAVNGKLMFIAGQDNTQASRGLWVSDGTEAGTRFLKRVQPDLRMLVVVGDRLFFQADDPTGATGRELWVSDGTEAGTRLVKDINPGRDGSYPGNNAFALGDTLLFHASSGAAASTGLWRSDGTEAGTFHLSTAIPREYGGDFTPAWAIGPGGNAYFAASDPAHGGELWKSDGTAAGTAMVADLVPGPTDSTPTGFSVMDGRLYFRTAAPDGTNARLWSSDGTAAGTQVVKPLDDASSGRASAIVRAQPGGDGLFLSGGQLWRTDGTAAGTTRVFDHAPFTFSTNLVASGGWVYYTVFRYEDFGPRQELWRTDGTAANTRRIDVTIPAPPDYQSPDLAFVDFGGKLFFPGTGSTGDAELMRLAPNQTAPDVIDVNPARPYGSSPAFLRRAGDYVYFLTRPGGYGTQKVWRTDGTEAGTVQLFDSGFGLYQGGIAKWGTAAFGARVVANIGTKVWTFGPHPGSEQVIANLDGIPDYNVGAPVVAGNKIFFSAYEPEDYRLGNYQNRLWVSDGGTAAPIRTSSAGTPYQVAGPLVVSGGVVYFSGTDASGNVELWRSDGTAAGTRRVKDIRPGGADGSWPEGLIDVGGTLYFTAMDSPPDPSGRAKRRLYKTDGTDAGTVRLSDTLRVSSSYWSGLPEFATVGNVLYFTAADESGLGDGELYRTDGTAAGTRRVADVVPGPQASNPTYLVAAGSRLFFVSGTDVYTSDGTEAGTRRVSDGLDYATTDHMYSARGPYGLIAAGDMVYFVASDGVRGAELWRSDGTPQGTVIVEDLNPGRPHGVIEQPTPWATTAVTPPAVLGDTLFFSATDGRRGVELWKARYEGEPTADAGEGYAAAEGEVITLSGAGSRPGIGGGIVSYEWDLDFDGTFTPDATGATVNYTGGDGPATRFVALRVTNANGAKHLDTAPVVITNRPPRLDVSGPATTTEGAAYPLRLEVADNPGVDTVLHWWVNWGDGTPPEYFNGTPDGSPLTVTHFYGDGPANFVVSVLAGDDDGTYATDGVRVDLLDPSFGDGGRVTSPFGSGRAIAVGSDGRIVTAGGAGDFLVSRYLPDGSPDASFGTGGHATAVVTAGDDRATAVAVLADGRVVVAGTALAGGDADWVVVRLRPDGSLDPSFGQGGVVVLEMGVGAAAEATDLAVQPDGKIIVVGSVEGGAAAGGLNFAAVRLGVDGTPDAGFGAGGTAATSLGATDRARAVALQPDGKIVLAGVANAGTSTDAIGLVRFTPAGELDATFGTGGKVSARPSPGQTSDHAYDLALQPDGRIVVVGASAYSSGPYRPAAFRYRADGSIDPTFGDPNASRPMWWETHTVGHLSGVAVAPGGTIVVSGSSGLTLGRLTPQGGWDRRFGSNFSGYGLLNYEQGLPSGPYQTAGVAVQPDGNVVLLGYSNDRTALARLGGGRADASVRVENVPPTGANAGADLAVLEGQRVALSATFNDPAVGESRTFRWRVASSNGQVVGDGNAAAFEFVPADEGTYTVQFTVSDESGLSASDVVVVTAANAPPGVNAGIDRTGGEGQEVSFTVAAPTDPGATDTVTLRWAVTGPGGTTVAQGQGAAVRFTPGDDGAYVVTVTGTDNDGGSASDTAVVNVADRPPVLTVGGESGAFAGADYRLNLSSLDPSPDDHVQSWRVDWGDGEIVTYPAGDSTTVTHGYAAAGRYTIVARATDAEGTYTAAGKVVTVGANPVLSGGVLTVNGTTFDDVVMLRGEADGSLTVVVNGGARTYGAGAVQRVVMDLLAGNDTLNVLGQVPETDATLGVGNDVVVHRGTAAGAGLRVLGGAGSDTFQAGEGAGGAASFDGASQANAVLYDTVILDGTAGDDVLAVTPTSVAMSGGVTVSIVDVERVTASGWGGNDRITLSNTWTALNRLILAGGDGDDTIVVGDPGQVLGWNVLAMLQLEGGAGRDSVVYNDQANPNSFTAYQLAYYGLSRSQITFNHLSIDHVTLNTGNGADDIAVYQGGTATTGSPELVINAGLPASGSPGDVLRFNPAQNAIGGQFTSSGAGAGRYTFINYPSVSFTGVEGLIGPDYQKPTVASTAFVVTPRQGIEVRFSENVRNSVQSQDLVVTNLATGEVVPATAFALQFATLNGGTVARWVPNAPMAPGNYHAVVRAGSVEDVSRNTLADDYHFDFTVPAASVAGRHVFYNGSAFDGGDALASAADDGAIAAGVAALLPGQVASMANVSSYSKGINGVMIDVAGLPAVGSTTLRTADFEFDVGGPTSWVAAPLPVSLAIRRAGGASGSDRITLVWADGVIRNTWLRITVKANANTGLTAPEVFYFGHLAGETGDGLPGSVPTVNATDLTRTRRAGAPSAAINNRYDFNRDGVVNAVDALIVRQAQRRTLPLFTAPAAPVAPQAPSFSEVPVETRRPAGRPALRSILDIP